MRETRSAAVIASAGRPDVLTATLDHLLNEVAEIDLVIVCVPDQRSLPEQSSGGRLQVLLGPRGLAAQRNFGVQQLSEDVDYIFFFDDDCLPHPTYVTRAVAHLQTHASCAGITGAVVYDGVKEHHISVTEGRERLRDSADRGDASRPVYGLYGCNFAVRRSAVRYGWFDDRLPFYSWLEDEDFSRRLVRVGELHSIDASRCVHLGSPSGGRTSHLRFGYSQVMNPVYLRRKGSITALRTIYLIGVPLLGNIAGLTGRGRTNRLIRLRGDAVAFCDVLRNRITPERIEAMHEEERR